MIEPTREAALQHLKAFVPRVGQYAFKRNFDTGEHAHVSRLSPYLRHRILTEQEVLAEVTNSHPFATAEKFLQELCWRTYWKGWLEARPGAWTNFVEELSQLDKQRERSDWVQGYERALNAATPHECFNHWVRELVSTGYLHNHSRMWFASIWIFTLKLPWQLGAAFFHRHLLDGDPASNTLSWRWVAGLQTPGKQYLARHDNIEKYTEGRFAPKPDELAVEPISIDDDGVTAEAPTSVAFSAPPKLRGSAGLLILEDDLSPECSELSGFDFTSVAAFVPHEGESLLTRESTVMSFVRSATEDALARSSAHYRVTRSPLTRDLGDLEKWILQNQLVHVLAMKPFVGPLRETVPKVETLIRKLGIELHWVSREWEKNYFPFATRGFFQFWDAVKKKLVRGQTD